MGVNVYSRWVIVEPCFSFRSKILFKKSVESCMFHHFPHIFLVQDHENHTKIPSNPMSRNHETHPEKSSENPRRPACHTMDNDLQLMRTGMDLWRLILYVGIIVGIFNDQIFRIQDIYRFLDVCLLIYMDYIIDLFIMMHTLV